MTWQSLAMQMESDLQERAGVLTDLGVNFHGYTSPCWHSPGTRAMQPLVQQQCLESVREKPLRSTRKSSTLMIGF